MSSTIEIIEQLSFGQPLEISDKICGLLESRPNSRDEDAEIATISIVLGVTYDQVRAVFDGLLFSPMSKPPIGMALLACARLGFTAKPMDFSTLASAVRNCKTAGRYFLRDKAGKPFAMIGPNVVGDVGSRARVESAYLITPWQHSTTDLEWHECVSLTRCKYRGVNQPPIETHLSKCGQYKIEDIAGIIKLHTQEFVWMVYDAVFESVDDAKEFAANQSSSK